MINSIYDSYSGGAAITAKYGCYHQRHTNEQLLQLYFAFIY